MDQRLADRAFCRRAVLQPGRGFNIDRPRSIRSRSRTYVTQARAGHRRPFDGDIPDSFLRRAGRGYLLQCCWSRSSPVFHCLDGKPGERSRRRSIKAAKISRHHPQDRAVAPLGASCHGFTVGAYGVGFTGELGRAIAPSITSTLFVTGRVGSIARLAGSHHPASSPYIRTSC